MSESNVKVWDLEYDECIKNMNDHSSPIMYVGRNEKQKSLIMTIGAQFEARVWNYEITNDSQPLKLELGDHVKK